MTRGSLHHLTAVWTWLNGYAGVTAFFVLSGFLITTLSLREMRGGWGGGWGFSIRAFYLWRVHRILPLYVLTLVAYYLLTRLEDHCTIGPAKGGVPSEHSSE